MRRPTNTLDPNTTIGLPPNLTTFPLPQPHKSSLRHHQYQTSGIRPPKLTWRRSICIVLSFVFFVTSHALLASFRTLSPMKDAIILTKPKLEQSNTNNNNNKPHHFSSIPTTRQQQQQYHRPNNPNNNNINDPTPILVFGSHHTGTSIITKLLLEMGSYGGDPDKDLLMLPGNPLKYNEYNAAVEADKRVMTAGTPQPRKGPWWLNYGFDWSIVPQHEQEKFKSTVQDIVQKLRNEAIQRGKSTWTIKDPRMTLLATHWLEAAGKRAVCLIVTREPLQTSRRLARKYNKGQDESLSVSEWTRFWEEAMVRTLEACIAGEHEIVFAPHKVLVTSPSSLADSLALRLGLQPLSPETIRNLLGGSTQEFTLRAQVTDDDSWPNPRDVTEALSPRAAMVWRLLDSQDVRGTMSLQHLHPTSWSGTPPIVNSFTVPSAKGKIKYRPGKKALEMGVTFPPTLAVVEPDNNNNNNNKNSAADHTVAFDARKQITPQTTTCYATIVTGNDRGFVSGALTLAVSIRTFDPTRDLVAMISVEVDDPDVLEALKLAGWNIVRVPKLAEPWFGVGPCTHFTPGQVVRWGRMFSKLRVFSLPYERVLYLDTDTIVLRDPTPYFDLPGEFYAERSPTHDGFNAGIMLVRPSEQTLRRLIDYAVNNPPMVFWPSNQVGCTEQELLNRFYDGKRMTVKLNDTRHFDYMFKSFTDLPGREENKLHGARIAHSLTVKCDKAWEVRLREFIRTDSEFSSKRMEGFCDPEMYVQWYRYWQSLSIARAKEILLRNVVVNGEGDAMFPLGLQEDAIPKEGLGWVMDTINRQEVDEEHRTQISNAQWKIKNWKFGFRKK
jgi:hypothetical protein